MQRRLIRIVNEEKRGIGVVPLTPLAASLVNDPTINEITLPLPPVQSNLSLTSRKTRDEKFFPPPPRKTSLLIIRFRVYFVDFVVCGKEQKRLYPRDCISRYVGMIKMKRNGRNFRNNMKTCLPSNRSIFFFFFYLQQQKLIREAEISVSPLGR